MKGHGNSVVRDVQRLIMRGEIDSVLMASGEHRDRRRDHVRNCCRVMAMHIHIAAFATKKTQMSLAAICKTFNIKPRTLDRCIWTLRRCGMLYTVAAAHVVEYHDFYNGGKKIYRVKAATRQITELFFDKIKMNKTWIANAIKNRNKAVVVKRDYEVERMLQAGANATVIHIVQWKLRSTRMPGLINST